MSPILMSSRGRFTGTGSPSSFSFSLCFSSFSIIFPRWMVREGGESFVVLKRFLHAINRREILNSDISVCDMYVHSSFLKFRLIFVFFFLFGGKMNYFERDEGMGT